MARNVIPAVKLSMAMLKTFMGADLLHYSKKCQKKSIKIGSDIYGFRGNRLGNSSSHRRDFRNVSELTSVRLLLIQPAYNGDPIRKRNIENTIRNMYKDSEPMGRLHSVQKHMANVYLPLQFKEVKM